VSRILAAKLAFGVVGIALFAYGIRADEPIFRWVGIGFVAVAFLLRFLPGGMGRRR
jgi:hypothetical protein